MLRDIDGVQRKYPLRLTPIAEPLSVSAGGDLLPQTASGYGPVGELRMAGPRLASLSPPEAAALASYLAACGRLVVPDADAALLRALRAAAGCGGAFVSPRQSLSDKPDTDCALPALAPAATGAESRLFWWFLPYPLMLLALACLPADAAPQIGNAPRWLRVGPWLLLVPPATALMLLVVVPKTVATAKLHHLGVMSAEDRSYRWQGDLVVIGGGGQRDLAMPPLSAPPFALDGAPQRLQVSAHGNQVRVPVPRRLLAARRYRVTGVAALPWRPRARLSENDLRLENRGDRVLPAGWLFVADPARPGRARVLAAPELAPGAAARIPLQTEERVVSAEKEPPHSWMLGHALYSIRDGHPAAPPAAMLPALVLPLPLPAGADPRIEARGQLILRLTAARL
jgi:hypothetical protein